MSDSEYEEEEFLVFADFKNQILPNEVTDPKAAIKIIGVESKNPIAEVNGNIFKGTYGHSMGTHVFFEKDDNAIPADPLFEQTCKQKYKYFDKTAKVINFERIYVEKQSSADDNSAATNTETESTALNQSPTTEEESLKIDLTYEEAIKKFPTSNDT